MKRSLSLSKGIYVYTCSERLMHVCEQRACTHCIYVCVCKQCFNYICIHAYIKTIMCVNNLSICICTGISVTRESIV